MKVYVSDDLEYVKQKLLKKGYTVVKDNESSTVDAIICNLKSGALSKLSFDNNIKKEGALIIDCGNKSIDDIEYILNNRAYNNLY
ncbi:hypothetical protein D4Z93_13050 [Clostridium fermenticellae]|uniref:YkuS family protein n=1 Tax=Clostridium fermenticellae TaxID=2068654 RepID=A0A386H746_9CLOT|nr:YkuS family protein [Clostridium fermenticellae]AYD41370.1 hypothetical protein D4Z93_13050 [Clostridium fermenticellae]